MPATAPSPATQSPTYRETVSRLRSAQKPKSVTPAYLRFVNRRLGGYLAAMGFVRGWTPNGMTAASALLSLAGALAIALISPSVLLGLLVALALLAGYAFDSADGQLARLRGGGSPAGEWLDHVVDAVKTCVLHATVLISFYRFGDRPAAWVLLLPLVFLTASISLAFATMLRDVLLRPTGRRAEGADSLTKGLAMLPIDYGTLCLAFLVFGVHDLFVMVYTALTVLLVLFMLRLLVRSYGVLVQP